MKTIEEHEIEDLQRLATNLWPDACISVERAGSGYTVVTVGPVDPKRHGYMPDRERGISAGEYSEAKALGGCMVLVQREVDAGKGRREREELRRKTEALAIELFGAEARVQRRGLDGHEFHEVGLPYWSPDPSDHLRNQYSFETKLAAQAPGEDAAAAMLYQGLLALKEKT